MPAYSSFDLISLGWSADRELFFASLASVGLAPGRVVRVDRAGCEVIAGTGPAHALVAAPMLAAISIDPLAAICTGDWVALRDVPGEAPVIESLLPRSTAFVRATSSRAAQPQVLAANVDVAFIVHSLTAEPRLSRIERFLSLAWDSGAQPLVVLSKADLASDAGYLRAEVADAAPGVEVLTASTVSGEGMTDLRARIPPGRTGVFLGVSGAGKSSLVNALTGEARLAVEAIRGDGKGRHTSTARELVVLPGGGAVIDTPGLRGVGMWEGSAGLRHAFSDIEELAAHCRFNDCAHGGEPGCAVATAIEEGELSQRRLESHRKLTRESDWIAARSDARLRAERRNRWKAIHREQRRHRPRD